MARYGRSVCSNGYSRTSLRPEKTQMYCGEESAREEAFKRKPIDEEVWQWQIILSHRYMETKLEYPTG